MIPRANSMAVILLLYLLVSALSLECQETMDKVYVRMASLPEPFNNEKLPKTLPNTVACYETIGCFEPLPISQPSKDPLTMKTEFLMYSKSGLDTRIKFEAVLNCLQGSRDVCLLYPFNLQSLLDAPYKPEQRTVILVSGYLTKAPTDWEQAVVDIWAELEDVNLILVDWSASNGGSYSDAASSTRLVSRQITVLLYYLAKLSNLDLGDVSFAEKFYMVGHSLGAHISGFVGMDLDGALGRITGLDPAGPGFDGLPARFRLDRSDAQIVDAIHSNGGAVLLSTMPRYGTGLMSGHVDLYANDGTHQPGCSRDFLGCSHGKSNKYYVAFLLHELNMRDQLKEDYSPLYRLNAYASQQFATFQNGISLMRSDSCPSSSLNETDLFSSDLDLCSVPVDYTNWDSDFRKELATRHGIDFTPESRRNNSYFFFTAPDTDDQMGHYLMRVRVARTELRKQQSLSRQKSWKARNYQQNECDLSFQIQMNDGQVRKHKVEQYRLIHSQNHYKIVLPYLLGNHESDIELSLLDSQDYHLVADVDNSTMKVVEDEMKLHHVLLRIFPQTITLRGFHVDEEVAKARRAQRKNPGILKTISNVFNMIRGKEAVEEDEGDTEGVSCNLSIQHLAVRPLRRLHRSIVAYYSYNPVDILQPKIIVLADDNQETLNKDLGLISQDSPAAETNHLQLNSVIIGPYDKSFIKSAKMEVDPTDLQPIASSTSTKHILFDVSSTTWIVLAVLLITVIICLIFVVSLRGRKVSAVDTEILMNSM